MKYIIGLIFCIVSTLLVAQETELPVYKNAEKGVEQRVEDLLSRMTIEEKVELLAGIGDFTRKNVRLGIPIFTYGTFGIRRQGPGTYYSSYLNMAATFDIPLMTRIGEQTGTEARVQGYNMISGPQPNIIRVPKGGRTFESFSEDPYLSARMTVAYVKGMQSKKVCAIPKHYIANNQEWNRFDVDVQMSERTMREIYLPAFKAAVQEADAWSIMAAYNQVNGEYCLENNHLLNDILKDDWGFQGFVMTDFGGARSTVEMANNGMDIEMPMPHFWGPPLLEAVKAGEVSEVTIDDKVKRIIRVQFKAGLFDEMPRDYGGIANNLTRRKLALETAEKSIVLLKNTTLPGHEKKVLPLKADTIKKIAVIGPNANVPNLIGGGSGAMTPHYFVNLLDGIKKKVGNNVTVEYLRGTLPPRRNLPIAGEKYFKTAEGQPGLFAEFFNNRELTGEPVLTRIDKSIDFNWGYGTQRNVGPGSPEPGVVDEDKFSARWTGKFVSPGDGVYEIGLKADNGVRMWLNGTKIIDAWTDASPGKFKITKYKFEANREYDLKVEFYENWGSCRVKLGIDKYNAPETVSSEAIKLAEESDAVILSMGIDQNMEGEQVDRLTLVLPQDQIDLINALAKVNKNTIVVLNNATSLVMNKWLDNVPAVIEAFYPGQELGNALAGIIFGDVNPSGKMPYTFPKKWEDTPVAKTYPGPKPTAHYDEGIFMGYRHYDKFDIEPLFPFGYGLSYTTFEFSDLKLSKNKMTQNDSLVVEVTIKNTGKVAGDEVVQLYISDIKASVEREVKSFKGFKRVSLKPGESKSVSLKIDQSALAFFDEKTMSWVVEPGKFEVLVGNSSRNILLSQTFSIKK